MGPISIQYFDSPYGELVLGSFNARLCLCDWRYRKKRTSIDSRIKSGLNAEYSERDDVILEQAQQELDEYFNRKRKKFDTPLHTVGTSFQKRVWNSLLKIPFGKTLSYQQLAEEIGNRNAVRAVANANGANALSIFIPCHRIIGNNGNLTGYAGGVEVKAKLLKLEFDLFV